MTKSSEEKRAASSEGSSSSELCLPRSFAMKKSASLRVPQWTHSACPVHTQSTPRAHPAVACPAMPAGEGDSFDAAAHGTSSVMPSYRLLPSMRPTNSKRRRW